MKPPIKKIATGLSLLILFLFVLSYYSHLVYEAALKGKDSGFVAHHLTNFANYPKLISEVLTSDELAGIPPSYVSVDSDYKEVNTLTYDLYALNSFWNKTNNDWDIQLFNLKNDSVLFSWSLNKVLLDFTTTQWNFPNAVPRNCIVLPDKSLIISADESANLMRLDSTSKPIWQNHSLIFHHSLNLDADSNIWACTSDLVHHDKTPVLGVETIEGKIYRYKENYITLINQTNGKILFHKGISKILRDNGYPNFVYGFSDPDQNTYDPIHLNDIQPILSDSDYWKKGDLLISIRHRSLILLYRPSTNKIIRCIFGSFINQHDVDVVSDGVISIFNNNFIHLEKDSLNTECTMSDTLSSSEIVVYNFSDSTFQKPLKAIFVSENIHTPTQGMHRKLKNGDFFVESQNQGKVFVLNSNGVVLRKMFLTKEKNWAYQPNWIRIYEIKPF